MEQVAASGAVQFVIEAIADTNAKRCCNVVSQYIIVLGILAESGEARSAELAAQGAIEAILTALRDHRKDEGVQCHGCHALAILAEGDDDELRASPFEQDPLHSRPF